MAAAAIPLALEAFQLASPLIPLIKALISHIHNHTQPVPTPEVVHATVSNSIQPVIDLLVKTGTIPTSIDPNVLSGTIQTLINEMSAPTPVVPTPPPTSTGFTGVIDGNGLQTIAPVFAPGTKIIVAGTLTLE
jgi:hypothetical protein